MQVLVTRSVNVYASLQWRLRFCTTRQQLSVVQIVRGWSFGYFETRGLHQTVFVRLFNRLRATNPLHFS